MTASEMRLKVLFLTPPAKAGGALAAQSFVEEEIRAIRDFNVQPYVLTDEIRGRTEIDGVPLAGIPRASLAGIHDPIWLGLTNVSLAARLWQASRNAREIVHALRVEAAAARLIAHEGIDVVHSHFGWPAGLGGALAARATGVPLVTSVRGTDVLLRRDLGYGLRGDPAYEVALRLLFRRARRILVATTFMRVAATHAGADPHKIQVIDKGSTSHGSGRQAIGARPEPGLACLARWCWPWGACNGGRGTRRSSTHLPRSGAPT